MSKVKKPYEKPKISIIPHDSPKYKEILQHLERQSRGQRFDSAAEPDTMTTEKT